MTLMTEIAFGVMLVWLSLCASFCAQALSRVLSCRRAPLLGLSPIMMDQEMSAFTTLAGLMPMSLASSPWNL